MMQENQILELLGFFRSCGAIASFKEKIKALYRRQLKTKLPPDCTGAGLGFIIEMSWK